MPDLGDSPFKGLAPPSKSGRSGARQVGEDQGRDRGQCSPEVARLVTRLRPLARLSENGRDTLFSSIEQELPLFNYSEVRVALEALAGAGSRVSSGTRAKQFRTRVLSQYVNLPGNPSVIDNAMICRALGGLDERDKAVISKATTHALRLIRYSDPFQTLQIVRGLTQVGLRDGDYNLLMDNLCHRALEIRDQFKPEEFITLTQRLGFSLTVHKELFAWTCSRVVSGEWRPHIEDLGALAACLSEANFFPNDFAELVKRTLNQHLQEPAVIRLGDKTLLGLCRCLRSLDVAENPAPLEHVNALRDFVEKALPSLNHAEGPRVLRQLAPVLVNREVSLPDSFTDCLEKAEWSRVNEKTLRTSGAADGVAQRLTKMGLIYDQGKVTLGYDSDFLIKTHRGSSVNLEVDGDPFHRVRIVGESTPGERTWRDRYRDQVLKKWGISVVRVFTSEYHSESASLQPVFLWMKLKDFSPLQRT